MHQGGRGGKTTKRDVPHWQPKEPKEINDSIDALQYGFASLASSTSATGPYTTTSTSGTTGVYGGYVDSAGLLDPLAGYKEDMVRLSAEEVVKNRIEKEFFGIMKLFHQALQEIKIEQVALEDSGLQQIEPFKYIEEKHYLDKQYFDVCEMMADEYTISFGRRHLYDVLVSRGFLRGD